MSRDSEPQHTIIVASRDRLLIETIAETLGARQRQFFAAHHVDDVLLMAQKLSPALIIVEVETQDNSGLRVSRALKEYPDLCAIPLLLMARNPRAVVQQMALAAGADECIPLPFSPVELIIVVDALLAGEGHQPQQLPFHYGDQPPEQLVIYAYELRHLYRQDQARQEALKMADQRAQELNRLKSAFISAVTNELLSPFVPLRFAVQSLERQKEGLPDAVCEGVDELSVLISGLQNRIKGLVNFAKLAQHQYPPNIQPESLDEIVPWAVEPVAMMAQTRAIDFRVFVAPDMPKVPLDAQLVREAIFQMAHNAMKFNRAEGKVEIRVEVQDEHLLIRVTDTGAGLGAEQLAVLAQPFGQMLDGLKLGQTGLGVGWATVGYIADIHGGWKRVESPGPGEGSTFTLALPLHAAE